MQEKMSESIDMVSYRLTGEIIADNGNKAPWVWKPAVAVSQLKVMKPGQIKAKLFLKGTFQIERIRKFTAVVYTKCQTQHLCFCCMVYFVEEDFPFWAESDKQQCWKHFFHDTFKTKISR